MFEPDDIKISPCFVTFLHVPKVIVSLFNYTERRLS